MARNRSHIAAQDLLDAIEAFGSIHRPPVSSLFLNGAASHYTAFGPRVYMRYLNRGACAARALRLIGELVHDPDTEILKVSLQRSIQEDSWRSHKANSEDS